MIYLSELTDPQRYTHTTEDLVAGCNLRNLSISFTIYTSF